MKLLSIVISVYNIENYVSKCIESIIKQKGEDIEIIIIDDGSTDNSLKICKKYQKKDKRIKLYHQKNKGINDVRNKGYEYSSGQYIWHIDGDDFIAENSVDILRNYFNKYDIIYFNYSIVDNDQITKVKYDRQYDNDCEKYILGYTSPWNKVVKRSLYDGEKYPEKCYYNDIYLIPILSIKTNSIIFLDDFIYFYVSRGSSATHTRAFNMEEYIYCLDNVYNRTFPKYPNAAVCFYINQLLVYMYAKEIRYGVKSDYRKLNKILKEKCPKYYKNKYYNDSLFKKIYIRLIYCDMIFLVKMMTFLKIKVLNKYHK